MKMMKKHSFILNGLIPGILLLSLFGGTTAHAVTWTVDDDLVQFPGASFTTIQAAVDAASSGDIIQVYPGIYDENILIDKTLTLLGAQYGKDGRSRKVPLTKESYIVAGDNHFNLKADNIVVDGFWIDVDLRDDDEGVGIQTFTDYSGYIIINNIMDARLTTALVPGNGGQYQMLVRHNLFLRRFGIDMDSELGTGVHNVVIEENLFKNSSLLLSNNSFSDIWIRKNKWIQGGISIDSMEEIDGIANYNISITQNKIYDSNYTSLGLTNVADIVVEDNILTNGHVDAIYLYGSNSSLQIVNNRISKFDNAGINIFSDDPYFAPLTDGITEVFNNEIEENRFGIVFFHSHDIDVHGNSIENNDEFGIYASSLSANNLIEGNEIRGNGVLDARDGSIGAGTAGTANTWIDNEGSRCMPTGICTD